VHITAAKLWDILGSASTSCVVPDLKFLTHVTPDVAPQHQKLMCSDA
jgi:hypothetical protein